MRKLLITAVVVFVGLVAVKYANKLGLVKRNEPLRSVSATTSEKSAGPTPLLSVTADVQDENNLLKNRIEVLEKRISELEQNKRESVTQTKINFKKWNCWCALRGKLKRGEDFSSELKNFRELFASCPDLLNAVNKLTEIPIKDKSSDSLVNNLLKFARIKRLDENELTRVSGYVLMLSFTEGE